MCVYIIIYKNIGIYVYFLKVTKSNQINYARKGKSALGCRMTYT